MVSDYSGHWVILYIFNEIHMSSQPAVCTRELCVFSFYTLGVMSGAVEDVATGAEVMHMYRIHIYILRNFLSCSALLKLHQSNQSECMFTFMQVVDLLVAMCRAALESSRKSIIFDPYPSVVDPFDPKALAFNPKVQDFI